MATADALIPMTAQCPVRHRTMASSTLRCTHAKCDLCFSQNLLPTARTMSATSRVGRLIASSASGSASLRRAWTPLWLPVGWESLAGGAATGAGKPSCVQAWSVREGPGRCADRRRPPPCGWQSNVLRPFRTTHDLYTTKICYQFHPFYGAEVELVRYLRRTESGVLIVRLPGGAQVALPEWMLNRQACDRLSQEEKPRIAIDALLGLRRLIDAHRIHNVTPDGICAESASGGQDAQQRSDRTAARAAVRGGRDLERTSGIDAGTLPNSVAPK